MKAKIPSLIIVVLVSLGLSPLIGQQLQSWSSFYENGFVYNPALTARWNFSEVSITHRQNWINFEDAPETSMLGFQFPFLRRTGTKVAIGGYIEQDKVGPFVSQTIAGTFAYKIKPQLFGKRSDVLTFGVKGGVRRYDFNPSQVIAFDGFEVDPLLPNLTSDQIHPTIDVGVFYNSIDNKNRRNIDNRSHFFFGIALRDLIPNDRIYIPAGQVESSPHLSLHGGYRYVPRNKRHYFEHNYLIDYAIARAWLAMYNFRFEKMDLFWLSAGAVTNGELFMQVGTILSGSRFDKLSWLLSDYGTIRIGAKANYNPLRFGNYSGIGFEVYIAYQFNLI